MQFPTTRWDELAQASLHGDRAAREALDRFCRNYWEPVHAFLRWKDYSELDAEDLTQEFFLNFINNRSWRRADPLHGSFRTFLLGALMHRLQKVSSRKTRLKRGGDTEVLSLDNVDNADDRIDLPTIPPAAAAHFDRAWARQLLKAAMARTRETYTVAGKQPLFDALKIFLGLRQQPESYEEKARNLGITLPAVKTEIHRLRGSFRSALRMEIGQTVSAPHEVDEELRHLRAVLASPDLNAESPNET